MKSNERVICEATMTREAIPMEQAILDTFESAENYEVANTYKKRLLLAEMLKSTLAAFCTQRIMMSRVAQKMLDEKADVNQIAYTMHLQIDAGVAVGYLIGKYAPGNECLDSIAAKTRMQLQALDSPEIEKLKQEKKERLERAFSHASKEVGVSEEILNKIKKDMGFDV